MKTHTLFALLILLLFTACKNEKKKKRSSGKPEKEAFTYINDEIGWEIDIPIDWSVISPEQMDEEQKQSNQTVNDEAGLVINDQITNLIGFSKSNSNNFKAFLQPYHDSLDKILNVSTLELNKTFIKMAEEKNMKADTSSGFENIHNYNYKYSALSLSDKEGKAVFSQRSYYRLVGPYMFCANFLYTNNDDFNLMMSAFANSKFK